MASGGDPRAELAQVAASLRAYLEVQADTGAWGIPRGTKTARTNANPNPNPNPNAAPNANANPNPQPPRTRTPPQTRPERGPARAPNLPAAATPLHPPGPTVAPSPPRPLASPRLPLLAAEVAACTKCPLHATRTQTVFARGNPEAQLCVVGEAPGADEDAQGLPFVGRAGQLLDKMIAAMGLDPERDVYVCNILKCRPPGNRRPEPEETSTCIPYLHEQLAIVHPKVIVAMGNSAVQALLGTKLGITKVRGSWKLYKGATLVMPTFHPSYLLRPSPQQVEAKKQAWEDLQAVMKELGLALPKKRAT